MRLATLLLSSLVLVAIHAHGAGALAVRNLSVDSAKQQVSFEIVNVSTHAVHSWTMTIASKKKPPEGDTYRPNPYQSNMLTTSEVCSREVTAPLAPGEARNCIGSVFSGEPAPVLSAEVIVTSVLFEDGAAAGDVTLLDNLARVRRSQLRYLEFWLGQLEPALAAPTPRAQLQAMQKALSVPDSAIPLDLRYDPTAAQGRNNLLIQVAHSLQMLDDPRMSDPRAQAMGTVQMLKQRLDYMRTAPDAFPPRRGANLTPPVSDLLQGWKAIARTKALQLVAVRDASSPMNLTTFFLQNVTQKPITALAVAFGGSDEGGGNSVDCFAGGGPMAVCVQPGASYALSQVSPSDHTLIVKAVVFEDGSGDGVQRDIDMINFTRLGRIFETERIRNIADAADTDFNSLPAKVGELPQSPDAVFPSLELVKLPGITLDRIRSADPTSRMFFLNGVHSAREGSTRNLAEYQRRAATPAAALEEMRRELRDLSGRYRAYCERVYATAK